MSDAHDRGGLGAWRRRLRRAAFVALAFALLAVVLLATGWLQRTAIEWVAQRALGAEVAVGRTSVYDRLRVSEIRVFDDAAARTRDAFAARLTNLDIDYALWPADGRYVRALTIGDVTVRLDGTDPRDTNYDFLLRLLEQPSSTDPVAFIPRTSEIRAIACDVALPTLGVEIDGLRFSADVEDLARMVLEVQGEPVSARWWFREPADARNVADGRVDLRLERLGDVFTVAPAQVSVPGLLEVTGQAHVVLAEEIECNVDLETFLVHSLDLVPNALMTLPVAVRFDTLDLSGTRLRIGQVGGAPVLRESELRAAVKALEVGEQYQRLYEGDAALHAAVTAESEGDVASGAAHVDLEATLNRGQRITGQASGGFEGGTAEIALEDWSREDVLAVIPQGLRYHATLFSPLERVSASLALAWSKNSCSADVSATPVFVVAGAPPERLVLTATANATFAPGVPAVAEGTLTAQFREQTGTVEARAEFPERYSATLRLDGVTPADWVKALTDERTLSALDTCLTGTVGIQPEATPERFEVALDVTASPFLFNGMGLPPGETLGIAGKAVLDQSGYGHAEGEALDVRVGADISLQVRDWRIAFDTFAAEAEVSGEFDLGHVGTLLSLGDLWGQAQGRASFGNRKGVHTVDFDVRSDSLGYGAIAAPYGMPIVGTGSIHYDMLGRRGGGNGVSILMGEGTSLRSETWTFELTPLALEWPFRFETDWTPLVEMGYLDSATGSCVASGRLGYREEALSADATFQVDAPSMVLLGALAAFRALSATGSVVYGETRAGQVEVRTAEVVAAGATVRDVQGRLALEGDVVHAEEFTGTLFGGTLRADGEVKVSESGLPTEVSAHVDGLDVDRFVQEMAPESAKLTGTVAGDLNLGFDLSGFTGLRVDLSAGKGFSVDRETILKLLQRAESTDEVSGVARASRTTEQRLIDKVVGEAPQRSFDRAELKVECAGRELEGTAQVILESERLNLTIDLPLRPGTLARMLELRQLEKVENFRAESVGSGE